MLTMVVEFRQEEFRIRWLGRIWLLFIGARDFLFFAAAKVYIDYGAEYEK